MDPEANLLRQLRLAEEIVRAYEGGELVEPDDAYALAELVTALHGWLTTGGFLPSAWCARAPRLSTRG